MKTKNDVIYDISVNIPIGRKNAVSRKYLSAVSGLSDRRVRQAIEHSSAPIINLGYGYFIPDEHDMIDKHEVLSYCAQERARIRSLEEKLEKFNTFELE